jgi:hypothetical protein
MRELMLLILPLICFITIFLVFSFYTKADWRERILLTSIVWAVYVTGLTEILSILRLVTLPAIAIAWGIGIAVALVILKRLGGEKKPFWTFPSFANWTRFEQLLIVSVVFVISIVGVIALQSPPNNDDSLSAHMSRVMNWMQNQSIAYYPTPVLTQLHVDPWGAFTILNLLILNNGEDRFVNLVQWYSMVGCILGVSLIAQRLGADRRGQLIASVVCATIPMGIVQGSSTQNDYMTSFWIVCTIYFALKTMENYAYPFALATGAALGLAVLTKATTYVHAFIPLLWVFLEIFVKQPKKFLQLGILVAMIALVLNVGHYQRNLDLYGNPLGPGQEGQGNDYKYTNDVFTLSSVASNLIRNTALHVGTPINAINRSMTSAVFFLHQFLGISPNDPRTTWTSTEFQVPSLNLGEDMAGNLLHLALLFLCGAVLCVPRFRLIAGRPVLFYGLALLGSFVLFCLVLKWQPWNSRLHLPLFVLGSAWIGVILSRLDIRFANLIPIILLIFALPWLFRNPSRPLLKEGNIFQKGRLEQYFVNHPTWETPFENATRYIAERQCSEVGLYNVRLEYPLWVLLRTYSQSPVHIVHVNVTNVSQSKYDASSARLPCAIIATSDEQVPTINVGNVMFSPSFFASPVTVLVP